MRIRDEQPDKKKQPGSSRNRFESMRWLYRDELSYQRAMKQAGQANPAGESIDEANTEQPAPPKPLSNSERFRSAGRSYKDSINSYSSASRYRSVNKPVETPPLTMAESFRRLQDAKIPAPPVRDIVEVKEVQKTSRDFVQMAPGDEEYEAMRWLYDDEKSFQKAVTELKLGKLAKEEKRQATKKLRADKIKRVKHSLLVLPHKVAQYAKAQPKQAMIGGGVLAAGLLVVGGVLIFGVFGDSSDVSKVAGDSIIGQKDPEFDTVLPNDDLSQADASVAYDEKVKVASYIDTIDSTKVAVSQQPLPERFKVNQMDEFEKFATEINANQMIQAGDTRAYMGVSVKGPQTVVLIKNDLLVFLKSESEISTGAWIAYIESLK